jgi:hypothetical protein
MTTHVQVKLPDGTSNFVDLPADMSVVQYRDSVWPQGIAVEYSWTDGDPHTPPPASYLGVGAEDAFNRFFRHANVVPTMEPEADTFPWAAVGIAAVIALLLLRRKGA